MHTGYLGFIYLIRLAPLSQHITYLLKFEGIVVELASALLKLILRIPGLGFMLACALASVVIRKYIMAMCVNPTYSDFIVGHLRLGPLNILSLWSLWHKVLCHRQSGAFSARVGHFIAHRCSSRTYGDGLWECVIRHDRKNRVTTSPDARTSTWH